MNRSTGTLFILISIFTNSVVAETADFEGISAKLSINQLSLDIEQTNYIDNGVADPLLSVDKLSEGKTAAEIAVNYTWAINESWLLSLGYESTLGSQDYGVVGYTYNGSRVDADANNGLVYEVDSSSSFVVAPGILLSPNTAVFFRVGQSSLKIKNTDRENDDAVNLKHSGVLYGLGVEHNYSDTFFVFGTYDVVNYDDEIRNYAPDPDPSSTEQKVDSSSLKLGLGFRF